MMRVPMPSPLPDPAPDPAPPAATVRPRAKRRWLRWLFGTLLTIVLLVVAAPHAIALDAVRAEVEGALRTRLGTEVHIGRMGFSWFRGVAITEFTIHNPPAWPRQGPALHWQRAALAVRLLPLLRGEVYVDGRLDGLAVTLDQQGHGITNLQAIAAAAAAAPDDPTEPRDPADDEPSRGRRTRSTTWRAVHCNLQLDGATFEVRRDGERLDAITDLRGTVRKGIGNDVLACYLDGALRPLAADAPAGSVHAELKVDLRTFDSDLDANATGLDLQRYGPLAAAALPADTRIAGVLRGKVSGTRRGSVLALDGDLALADASLTGPAVGGLDLRGALWTCRPALRTDGTSSDTSGFRLDTGFLQLRGTAATAPGAASFAWSLDVDALSRGGELLPAWLRGSGARAHGTLDVPSDVLTGAEPAAVTALRAAARLEVPTAEPYGFALRAGTAEAVLQDGRLQVRALEPTRLAEGPLQFECRCDLADPGAAATTLTMRWQQGQLAASAAPALRWFVPLFAGLDSSGAALRGRCDFEATLAGPGRPGHDENWLQWLDRWHGDGRIAVRDGAVTPAAALAPLLQPLGPLAVGSVTGMRLGDGDALAIESFEAPFRFAQGAITTTTGKWLAKGRAIGVSGKVYLDGRLDYGFDLTALLRGHRDGDRVLAALGGQFPPARLLGTVGTPTLALPDFAAALQKLAERELQQRGQDLLKKELEDLLRKSKRR